jgi:hypothetical protein
MWFKLAAVVLVVFLVYVWLTYYNLKGVYVVRYYRPDCQACASSQTDWDKLKAEVSGLPADKKAMLKEPITFVDVNTGSTSSLHTYMWKSKHSPTSVPNVIILHDGIVTEFKGPDNRKETLEDFIGAYFTKANLMNKK